MMYAFAIEKLLIPCATVKLKIKLLLKKNSTPIKLLTDKIIGLAADTFESETTKTMKIR